MRFKVPFRGVHVGTTCVDGSPFKSDEDAHAHTTGCNQTGWICARSLTAFRELLIHEIAHLASDQGHTDSWRKSVRKLGGRVPAAYRKKPRVH